MVEASTMLVECQQQQRVEGVRSGSSVARAHCRIDLMREQIAGANVGNATMRAAVMDDGRRRRMIVAVVKDHPWLDESVIRQRAVGHVGVERLHGREVGE